MYTLLYMSSRISFVPSTILTTSTAALAGSNGAVTFLNIPAEGQPSTLSKTASFKFALDRASSTGAGTQITSINIAYSIEDFDINSITISLSSQSFTPTSTVTPISSTPSGFTLTPGNYNGVVTINTPAYSNGSVPEYFLMDVSVTVSTATITELRVNDIELVYQNNPLVTVGTTPRSVANKFQETISVKDYGAVGNGVTNDTTAFQSAIAATSNGKLYIPPGTYLLSFGTTNCLTMLSNMVLYGAGKGLTTLNFVSTVGGFPTLFRINTVNNIIISDMTIKYTRFNGSDQAFAVNFAGNVSNITFRNMEIDGQITDSAGTPSHIVYAFNFSTAAATQNFIIVDTCEVHNVTYGFLKTNAAVSNQNNITVNNCYFHDNYNADITLNTPNAVCTNISYTNNRCDLNRGYLIGAVAQALGTAGPVTNLQITGNTVGGVYLFNAIHLEEGPDNFVISNNIIKTQGWGITLQSNNISGVNRWPTNGVVSNNTVELASLAQDPSPIGIAIVFGVNFNAGVVQSKRVNVINNTISGAYAVGIQIGSRPEWMNSVCNNTVDGATIGFQITTGGFNYGKNLSSNCGTGLTGTSTSVDSHIFYGCTTNMIAQSTATGGLSVLHASFIWDNITISAASTVDLGFVRLGAHDRLIGRIAWRVNGGNPDYSASTDNPVKWDGTTSTITTENTYNAGSMVSTLTIVGGVLGLHVFSTPGITGGRAQADIQGFYLVSN